MTDDPLGADELRQFLTEQGLPAHHVAQIVRGRVLGSQALRDHPDMHPLTAAIMGDDMASAEAASARVAAGADPRKQVWLVGSFSRLQWALASLPRDWLLANLPDLWRGSDPDDTDPACLALWREAWLAADGHTVTDGQPLPRRRPLRVWRGQPEGAPFGIAWTLDPEVARKFAAGYAAVRVPRSDVVYSGLVAQPQRVMGYLTGRGESEVVVDPADVAGIQVVMRVVRRHA